MLHPVCTKNKGNFENGTTAFFTFRNASVKAARGKTFEELRRQFVTNAMTLWHLIPALHRPEFYDSSTPSLESLTQARQGYGEGAQVISNDWSWGRRPKLSDSSAENGSVNLGSIPQFQFVGEESRRNKTMFCSFQRTKSFELEPVPKIVDDWNWNQSRVPQI